MYLYIYKYVYVYTHIHISKSYIYSLHQKLTQHYKSTILQLVNRGILYRFKNEK